MKSLFSGLGLAAMVAFSGLVQAQVSASSLGEIPRMQVCPFTCKPGPRGTWQEVTTLNIVNASTRRDLLIGQVAVFFVDGSGNFLASSQLNLPRRDRDELNICRTLEAAGLPVPENGVAYPGLRLYVWRSNHIGRFPRTEDDPSTGRARAMSETECRVVSPEIADIFDINDDFNESGAPIIPPVIIGAPEE